MTDALPTQPGSIVGGRYRVDRIVGVGSMSTVVAATHLEIERPVAIKFLNPTNVRPDALERFRREAQNAARLKNEHVVRVIDIGSLGEGMPFIVMDLVEGRSLRDELRERGPFSVKEAVGLMLQAIEALTEAHQMGIVHRDLKPANLFLAVCADRSLTLKVLDFGVSKSLVDSHREGPLSLTRTGMVVGSPLYMPPEQLRSSRNVDHRADIWALGAVLYELVTGRVPFDAKSLPELCTLVLSDPEPVSQHRPEIPAEFEAVVRRCLAVDREARFQSMSELAAALAPFGGASPESLGFAGPSSPARISESTLVMGGSPSKPPSEPSPAPKKARRRVVLLASFAALLAGGFALLAVTGSKKPERARIPSVVTTSAAAAAIDRPSGPTVTPVDEGSVLAGAADSAAPAPGLAVASSSAAASSAPAPGAAQAPIRVAIQPYQPRFPTPPAPSVTAPSSSPESAITDFGGRK